MAIERYVGNRWSGLSSDTLPTGVLIGSVFHETDTGTIYIYNGTSWEVGPQVANLGDVTLTGLATGDFLSYNGTDWVNGQLVLADITDLGDLAVADLSDTNITTPANDEVLAWNGTDWVNVDIATLISEVNALNDLSDVTITTPADNEILAYNNGTGEWINQTKAEAGFGNSATRDVTGIDTLVVSGTAGTNGNLIQWDANGDAVDAGVASSAVLIDITAESIGDLSDVTITTVGDDDILAYDTTSGEWINQTKSEAGFGASATLDTTGADTLVVSGTAGTSGNVAQWNVDGDLVGTSLAVADILTDITNENIDDLSNVVITTATTGEFLVYNGTNWVNQTTTEAGILTSVATDISLTGDGTSGSPLSVDDSQISITFSQISDYGVTGLDANVVTGTAGTSGNLVEWNADGDAVDSGVAASSIPSTLNDLSDVVITTPADNEILAYDSGTGDWINQTPAEAGLLDSVSTDSTITGDGVGTPLSVNINDAGTATTELYSASHISSNYQPTSERNQANGYVGLDSNSKISSTYLPALSITEVFVVADITARDALTVGTGDGEVQEGDVAVVLDASADSQVPSGSASYIWDGTSWQIMGTPDIEAAGADTQIQYNNAGDFGASTNFTFDDVNSLMTLTGNLKIKENTVPTTPANDEAVYFVETDGTNTYVKVLLGNGDEAIVASYVQ